MTKTKRNKKKTRQTKKIKRSLPNKKYSLIHSTIQSKLQSKDRVKSVLRKLKSFILYDIKEELKLYLPPTNQRSSGRCWLYSYLSGLRLSLISKYKLQPTFYLSPTYMMFWDKYEKCNYFLHNVSKYSHESMDHIDNHFLFRNMISDGGTWNMIQNLVNKYGIVPYSEMKETTNSINTGNMNNLLHKLLQTGAKKIRNKSDKEHESIIKDQMKKIYSILVSCLGNPPKKIHGLDSSDKSCSPKSFYENYIRSLPGEDVMKHVVLIHVPHFKENQYYTITHMNNMQNGEQLYYFNVSLKTMKSLIIQQLRDKRSVWFGCDFGRFHYSSEALLNDNVYSFKELPVDKKDLILSKSNSIQYYQTIMNHAMIITGYYHKSSKNTKPLYWLIENSHNHKLKSVSFEDNHGHVVMSDSWFDSYVIMAVVHESYTKKNISLFNKIRDKRDAIILPKWSNLGELL